MRNNFADAALDIVDVRQAKGNRRKTLLAGALHLLEKYYPESAAYGEDLSEQMGKDGFVRVLQRNGGVQGFAAGKIYPDSKTAIISYFAVLQRTFPMQKVMPAPGTDKIFMREILNDLRDKGLQGVFVELYEPGRHSGGSEDQQQLEATEREKFLGLGFERMPVKTYAQPLGSDRSTDADNADGVHLHGLFAPGMTNAQKSKLTLDHYRAYAESYDADLSRLENRKNLTQWLAELTGARWKPQTSAQKLALT